MAPPRKAVNEADGLGSPSKRRKTTRQTVKANIDKTSELQQQRDPPQTRSGRQGGRDGNRTMKTSKSPQKGVSKQVTVNIKNVRPQRNTEIYTSESVSDPEPVVSEIDDREATEESEIEDEGTESEGIDEANENINQRGNRSKTSSTSTRGRPQVRKDRAHAPKTARVGKRVLIEATLAAREDANSDGDNDARSDFKESKLIEIMKFTNITKLGLKIKDYLKMIQDENPDSFSNRERLILSFPPAWQFGGERDLSEDVLDVDTKDKIWQTILRGGLKSQRQKGTKDLIAEIKLSKESLEEEIQRHRGSGGMTKDTGAVIPMEDYENLMRMYHKNCKNRFSETFKNAWKSTYDEVSLRAICRYVDQDNVDKGTMYDPGWTWLQNCIVKRSKVIKAEEYNQSGAPFYQIKKYINTQLSAMMKPETIANFHTSALDATFNGRRGTDQYELPQFLEKEIEAGVRDKKAQELLTEWRAKQDAQDQAESDDDNEPRPMVLAKDLLEKHLQNERKIDLLNSEITSAIDSRREQEISDWNDRGADEVLDGILRHLVKVVGNAKLLEACRRVGFSS